MAVSQEKVGVVGFGTVVVPELNLKDFGYLGGSVA